MRRRRILSFVAGSALLLSAAWWSACDRRHDPASYSPTAVADTLVLTADKTSIIADGSSTAVLTAEINPNAAPGRRTVELTASTGTFVGAPAATPTQILVDAVQGKASATLRSSSKVETASIDAKIKDGNTVLASAHLVIQFVAADQQAIQLTASPGSIPADGFSRTELVATISPSTPSDRRTVVFSATSGTLVNGSESPSTQQVAAGRDNTARTEELISSKNLETAIVTATLEGVTGAVDRVTVRFDPPDAGDILHLSTSQRTVPADGATVIQVRADVAPDLPQGNRTVTFTTTAGTLLDSSATADASNRATVDLRADTKIVTAVLRATVSVASAETTVFFERALPDFVIVTPGANTLKADGSEKLALTVDLRRNVGTVTEGTVVTFSAVDERDGSVGLLFRDVKPSTAAQVVTASAIAPVGTPPGTVTIRATVTGDGTTIVGEEKIVITP